MARIRKCALGGKGDGFDDAGLAGIVLADQDGDRRELEVELPGADGLVVLYRYRPQNDSQPSWTENLSNPNPTALSSLQHSFCQARSILRIETSDSFRDPS